jgi:hypothetical protein
MPKSFELPKTDFIQQGVLFVPYNCRQEYKIVGRASQAFWKYEVIPHKITPGFNYKNIEDLKSVTINKLNQDLQQYIYSYYDAGTQATINGYATRALFENRTDIVTECRKVQDWIDTVLDYYDNAKASLIAAGTDQERMCVTWDFKKDVPITDYVDWRYIKALFNA